MRCSNKQIKPDKAHNWVNDHLYNVWPLTFSSENEAPISSLPGHLFKAHQGGVNAETLATLPNPAGVTGADARYQGHWGQTQAHAFHKATSNDIYTVQDKIEGF